MHLICALQAKYEKKISKKDGTIVVSVLTGITPMDGQIYQCRGT